MNKIPRIDRSYGPPSKCYENQDFGFVFREELPKSRHRESNKRFIDKRRKK